MKLLNHFSSDAQGEGIARKTPEILEELIPPPLGPRRKIFFGGKISFFLLKCLFGFSL